MRRPCFAGEDVGLASIADDEAGYSGNIHCNFPAPATGPFFSKSRRGNSYRSLSSFSSSSSSSYTSPRSARLFEETQYHPSHFLEACFLCKKPLGNNRDIFMYRGDTPFCSEECRQEQIEIDEAKEKNCWNMSSSMKAIRKEQQSKATPNKSRNYNVRTSTVAAA